MAKRLQEYVTYTKSELDSYAQTPGSCVYKINSKLHFALFPFVLSDFENVLAKHIVHRKVGYYDVNLNGIVLAIKNVKVLSGLAAMRADDARIHVDINADCYIFRPEAGAELTGIVKHIGKHHVGAIIYRVFNANIRFSETIDKDELQLDQELRFRIIKFNLQNIFPYLQGEMLTASGEVKPRKIKFDHDATTSHDTPDSGIEDKNETAEIDSLLSLIKSEPASNSDDDNETPKQKRKATKRARKTTETLDSSTPINVKKEPSETGRSRTTTESSEASASFQKVLKKERSQTPSKKRRKETP